MSINGYSNTDDYGFHDIEQTSRGCLIEMDGVRIEMDDSTSGMPIYWFK